VCQQSNGSEAQRLTPTVACSVNSARTVRAESEQRQKAHRTVNSACPVRHRTVRCPKLSELQRSKPSEPLRLGDVAGAPDCPVRPSTAALPNGYFGGWGYKYPPTTTIEGIQVFSDISLNTRASAINTRHNSKESKPLQVSNTLQTPSD
jgi:hypothetical protein